MQLSHDYQAAIKLLPRINTVKIAATSSVALDEFDAAIADLQCQREKENKSGRHVAILPSTLRTETYLRWMEFRLRKAGIQNILFISDYHEIRDNTYFLAGVEDGGPYKDTPNLISVSVDMDEHPPDRGDVVTVKTDTKKFIVIWIPTDKDTREALEEVSAKGWKDFLKEKPEITLD